MPTTVAPPDLQHHQLVWMADRWLKGRVGCGITFRDQFGAWTSNGERPDAIGWRNLTSILIECKATRADFLADKVKPFRVNSARGMGDWRFYLCPTGLIEVHELPRGWGLLYAAGSRIRVVAGAPALSDWSRAPFMANKNAELEMMYAALRRVAVRGHLDMVYLSKGQNIDPGLTSAGEVV